jgi:hypothetical protein
MKYLNESHRKYSEACQKAVEEMAKHPLSAEEKEAQMLANRSHVKPYTNEARLRHFAELQEGLDDMAQHPFTREEMQAQSDRNRAILKKKGPQ